MLLVCLVLHLITQTSDILSVISRTLKVRPALIGREAAGDERDKDTVIISVTLSVLSSLRHFTPCVGHSAVLDQR